MKRLKVYPTGYYNYKRNRKNAKTKEKAKVMARIKEYYHGVNGVPGYRTIWARLAAQGIKLSALTVHKYMNKELGLKSVTRRKKRYTRVKEEPYAVFPDLLKQEFTADARGKKWCMDFTYIHFGNGKKRYNCTIIDLYSREVVATVNGSKINAELAKEAIEAGIRLCGKCEGLILHSDRGSQFTSKSFVDFCRENGIIQSMSKPGCPYDNAPMERYFNTLKTELLYLHEYETEEALYAGITRYAYGYYNNQRPHSYNGGLPPRKVA